MAGFIVYDLVFLAVFVIFLILFLATKRKNVQRQGILFLYKTKLGIEFIDWFAKKFKAILKPMQYFVLISGCFLMVGIIWLLSQSAYLYFTTSIAQVIRAPPVFPVIPYFPKIFGLESFFPPLYFTYFIIALGIIMTVHEFSHGIFARLNNIKIHSTGFAFFGPVPGAFVEQDEKQMNKASKFKQMSILAAGTFANVVTGLVFVVLMFLFFSNVFTPAGVKFSSYALAEIPIEGMNFLGNSSIEGYVELERDGKRYFIEKNYWDVYVERKVEKANFYLDAPAFRAQMRGAIVEIDGKSIKDINELRAVLVRYNPGDRINVKTALLEPGQGTVAEFRQYDIELIENNEGRAALGIVFVEGSARGITGWAYEMFSQIKNPFIHYESKWSNFGWFVYYLLWWIIVLNFLVALFNMLPLGILDGGRFFYLAVWWITGKKSIGKWAYKIVLWFILALLAALMIKWAMAFI